MVAVSQEIKESPGRWNEMVMRRVLDCSGPGDALVNHKPALARAFAICLYRD